MSVFQTFVECVCATCAEKWPEAWNDTILRSAGRPEQLEEFLDLVHDIEFNNARDEGCAVCTLKNSWERALRSAGRHTKENLKEDLFLMSRGE